MSESPVPSHLNDVLKLSDESRVEYLFNEILKHRKIWILTDEHGCVMLNTDDEDCIPVWPSQETAELWINQDWKHCTAESISLNKWLSRWSIGLEDDELAIVVFPDLINQGMILYPAEFEHELRNKAKKLKVKL